MVAETITEPAGSPETESFGYDAVGNRVFRATEAGVETSVYDENDRLLDDGTATYTWDEQGNLRSKTDGTGTTQYRWDGRDRLIEVSGPSTGLVQHVYDHAGDRVETRVDGAATKYLVDANRGLSQILEERTSNGSLVASYVHGDDGMVLTRRDAASAATAYYLHDAQHSVRQLASGGGAITDAYSYSAFGQARTASGSNPNRFRYGGQWSDARSGFYHLRARWMDPGIGRFVSVDPFGGIGTEPATQHAYHYAGHQPDSIRGSDRAVHDSPPICRSRLGSRVRWPRRLCRGECRRRRYCETSAIRVHRPRSLAWDWSHSTTRRPSPSLSRHSRLGNESSSSPRCSSSEEQELCIRFQTTLRWQGRSSTTATRTW